MPTGTASGYGGGPLAATATTRTRGPARILTVVDEERRARAVRALVAVLLVTAVGGALRFWQLGRPPEKVFDEVYYASDGCLYAGVDVADCGLENDAERSWVHPPLGRHLIALGVDGFGNRPFGWRVASAAAGTATVGLVGMLAFLLWGSPLWAAAASLLVATEHLHFVHSRIAMLDGLLAFFVVLGFVLLTWDRVRRARADRPENRGPPAPPTPPPQPVEAPDGGGVPTATEVAATPAPRGLGRSGPRWLRVGAGLAFGAATATKWSGALAWLGGLVLAVAWERTRRRRAGVARPLRSALREEWPSLVLAFVLAPLAVYTVTWTRWLANHEWSLPALWDNHVAIADYHRTLSPFEDGEPIHPYLSSAWTWLLLLRPVAYFWDGAGGRAAEILGIGNPVLFWGSLAIIPYLTIRWARGRDWRAGAILVPILVQYLPWLAVSRPLFLFYLTPVTPFLALGMTALVRGIARTAAPRRVWPAVAAGVPVALSVGAFAFFWPLLVGEPISMEAWRLRIWLPGWV